VPPAQSLGPAPGPPGAQSPFARARRYRPRRGVRRPVGGRYPAVPATTGSCASPVPSHRLVRLGRRVFAGCGQPLLGAGPSRRYLCGPFGGCLDPYPGGPPGALARFFPGDIGLPPVRTGSAPHNDPHSDFRAELYFGAAVSRFASGLHVCSPSRSLPPRGPKASRAARALTSGPTSGSLPPRSPDLLTVRIEQLTVWGLAPHQIHSLVGYSPNAKA
jgi:hypothetical protein